MIYVYYNDDAFLEIAECIYQGLGKLKIDSQLISRIDPKLAIPENMFIMLGLNNETPVLPPRYIAYQLEQTGNEHSWFSKQYLNKLEGAVEIWDYSIKNIQNFKYYQMEGRNFPNIKYVPMGYSPCLNKSFYNREKKYDILFYGSACPRRDEMIKSLRNAKFRVYYGEYSLWGEERDRLIAESRIVLNLHYYPRPILETSRLIYLLGNGAFVISEPSLDPILDKDFSEYVIFSEYDDLVEKCRYYLEHEEERAEFARQAHLNFMNKDFSKAIPTETLLSKDLKIPEKKHVEIDDDEHQGTVRPRFRKAEVVQKKEGGEVHEVLQTTHKLSQNEDEYPMVSLVTPTAGRTWALTTIALKNFYSLIYPAKKLEWIILDSDPTEPVNLPKDSRIKYEVVDGSIPLWMKRNMCVERARGSIIAHLDDDDYYLPTSLLAKVQLLNSYWEKGIECVGCTELGIYHLLENYSYLASTKYISEASMAYNRSFWENRQFSGDDLEMGEGYAFVKDREHEVLDMPYSFNFIALTHGENTTGALRTMQHDKHQSYDNFFNLWDRPTQYFFMELRAKLENLRKSNRLSRSKNDKRSNNRKKVRR